MQPVEVEAVADPTLTEPVLIEGLPGVGHVGKLAAEHLVEELDGELVRRVVSEHFPPQITVDDDGLGQLAAAEFYAVGAGDRDALVLVGDHQAQDLRGHYRLSEAFLDVAESFGVAEVVALGGVPTGELVEEPAVIGAVSDAGMRDRLEAAGVEFRPGEPPGGIVGTTGLLLGLGGRRGLEAACLLGETSGYLVDPTSAQAVLEVLQRVLGFEVDFATLEARAEELESMVSELQTMDAAETSATGDEDLRYFD
ncbi:MAG: proteasome assembly chaperone family protein [Halobacteriales archaeon]|nr:proteasome assembly chaperone family protein [Halobacteriales archaeon]